MGCGSSHETSAEKQGTASQPNVVALSDPGTATVVPLQHTPSTAEAVSTLEVQDLEHSSCSCKPASSITLASQQGSPLTLRAPPPPPTTRVFMVAKNVMAAASRLSHAAAMKKTSIRQTPDAKSSSGNTLASSSELSVVDLDASDGGGVATAPTGSRASTPRSDVPSKGAALHSSKKEVAGGSFRRSTVSNPLSTPVKESKRR